MKGTAALYRLKLHHLLVWLFVGVLWFYLRYEDYSTTERAVVVSLIKTVDLAFMIYIANYLLIPKLLYRRRYVWFVLAFLTMIIASSLYKMYLLGKITHNAALLQWSSNLKGRIYDNMLPHFFLVTAGVSVQLVFDYIRVQKRLAEVAREKAMAELSFLKSQINPHFLFNSLNAVYFLIDKNNTRAREALHTFSDMLRYQLYEAGGEKIPIEKEVGYLRDYIGLQQLRRDNCTVELRIQEPMKSFDIEPLLLLPFVENSFKHLSHFTTERNEIRIGLSRQDGELDFRVCNTSEGRQKQAGTKQEGGIGLSNVRRRLELLYPGRHSLQIEDAGNWFRVQLRIKTEQHESHPLHHH